MSKIISDIAYREINANEPAARKCARLIQEYSWGADYPIDAWSELKEAEYIIGAFDGEQLVGCASVTRVASPDSVDNGKLWFADAVVLPGYRRRGVYRHFYKSRLAYVDKFKEVIFSCTDNPLIEKFLTKNAWVLHRTTQDESGGRSKIFRLGRG